VDDRGSRSIYGPVITANVRFSLREVGALVERFDPKKVQATAFRGVLLAAMWGAKRTIETKLLGQVLRRRTGTLIRSIAASPKAGVASERSVAATFGTNLGYGIAHEEGFQGEVTVREHYRRRLGRPLAYSIATREVSKRGRRGAKERAKAGTILVREHKRRENIRARHYLRRTVREERRRFEEIVTSAFEELARTGSPPKSGTNVLGAGT
jgi:hypothetical protein